MKQSLDEILKEIGRTPLLSLEKELALVKAIQQKGPDCEEKEQLVKANLRFVVAVANQYHSRFVVAVANQYQKRGLTLEELIEVGNEGLVKAAEKYVPNAESKFISYAVWWIRQSIIQAIEEKKQK